MLRVTEKKPPRVSGYGCPLRVSGKEPPLVVSPWASLRAGLSNHGAGWVGKPTKRLLIPTFGRCDPRAGWGLAGVNAAL